MSNKFKLMLLCTFAFVLTCCVNIGAKENIKKVDVPKNIVLIRHTNTSLKIKWKKDKDAVAHNGKKTGIAVYVKNYARQNFGNYPIENDLYTLVTDYKDEIQNIAEYYSTHRIGENKVIWFSLNDDAQVEVEPVDTEYSVVRKSIEKVLINFQYYVKIDIHSDSVDFRVKMDNKNNSLMGWVTFYFDNDCSQWSSGRIASHWEAWRFYPD